MYKELKILSPDKKALVPYDDCIKGTLSLGTKKMGGYLCLASLENKFGQGDFVFKVLKDGYFSEEDVKEYYKFLENAGIKMPDVEVEDDHFKITYPQKRYKNWGEFLLTFTAVRYPFYNYARCWTYVKDSIDIHNKYDIPEMEALQLAHYSSQWNDDMHELFSEPSKLLSKEDYMQADFSKGVNEVFFKEGVSLSRGECYKLYNKNVTKLYDKLK